MRSTSGRTTAAATLGPGDFLGFSLDLPLKVVTQARNHQHRRAQRQRPGRMSPALDHMAHVQADAKDGHNRADLQDCPGRPVQASERLLVAELQGKQNKCFEDGDDKTCHAPEQGKVEAAVDEVVARRVFHGHVFDALHNAAISPRRGEEKTEHDHEEGPIKGLCRRARQLGHEDCILLAFSHGGWALYMVCVCVGRSVGRSRPWRGRESWVATEK